MHSIIYILVKTFPLRVHIKMETLSSATTKIRVKSWRFVSSLERLGVLSR